MNIFKDGDRVIVVKSVLGIYDGKKGTVKRVIDDETVEVVLDINVGSICEVTLLYTSNIKIDPTSLIVTSKQIGEDTKKILDMVSLDDRMDNLEVILGRYGLSVKEGCGFMYIYDFLDTLGEKWGEISKEDRDNITLCLLGEK